MKMGPIYHPSPLSGKGRASKMRTLPNRTVRSKIRVEQSMPGALDIVQFDIIVLLHQISRARDIAVGKSLNGDVCDSPKI